VAVGHSAGGHLALWLAGRTRLPAADPLRGKDPLALRGVVGLAPIPDLARAAGEHVCGNAVPELLGGTPEAQPARYGAASPLALLPLGVPQEVVHGRADRIVPVALSEAYVAAARGKATPRISSPSRAPATSTSSRPRRRPGWPWNKRCGRW
jgi:pimeloyl-ACP methyl ester carboxylesterase